MARIEWDRGLETGIPELDEQHKLLIICFNNLAALVEQGKDPEKIQEALGDLRNSTSSHSSFEEALMERAHYPEATRHQRIHGDLQAQMDELFNRISQERIAMTLPVVDFLAGWLVHHIKGEDLFLARFLERN
jgi:hemerythrin-like metal-binding protein